MFKSASSLSWALTLLAAQKLGSLFSPDNSLNLDSLSALELLSEIEYRYKIHFDLDGSAREHFRCIASLAAFVNNARV